jgi:hypothetical protein
MIRSILERLGLVSTLRKQTVTTVRLDVYAEQVREFNEAKKQINDKIETLEERTKVLDDTVSKTLGMTRENQSRLDSIEENLEKVLAISEAIIKHKVPGADHEQK